MESLVRRRFFIVHLACVLAASFLCARAVNVVVSAALPDLAPPAHDVVAGAPVPIPASRSFAAASLQNIFGARRDAPLVDDLPIGPAGPWQTAVLTSSRLRLVGTAVFVDETLSIASIVDEAKGGDARMHSINACTVAMDPCNLIPQTGTVARIEPERVYFWNDTQRRYEYVALDEPSSVPSVAAKRDVGHDVRMTGDGAYEVGQREVDRALNDLPSLAKDARVVPAFEGGAMVGFKLFSIRPGSLFAQIGLHDGDVLQRVNGHEITSPDAALEAYAQLKDSKSVSVDLKRRGKATTLRYAITP
jgi:general secretion pathway protein C